MRTAFIALFMLCLCGAMAAAQAQPYAHLAPHTAGGTAALTGPTFRTYVTVGVTAIESVENAARTRVLALGPWPIYALRRQEDTGTPIESPDVPVPFRLDPNYPNPFNPATAIRFSVPEPVHTRLTVYDALGRTVGVLVDGHRPPGTYSVSFDAGGLPSGVYLYRLDAGGLTQTRAMLLAK